MEYSHCCAYVAYYWISFDIWSNVAIGSRIYARCQITTELRKGLLMVDVIHLGMHKAASTYLQEVGFDSHPNIRTITWRNSPDMRGLMLALTKGYHVFDIHDLNRFLREVRAQTDSKQKLVWSFEGLSGSMYSGFGNRFVAEQLSKMLEQQNITIILILRNQYEYLNSCWCHYVREGGGLSLSQFLSSSSSPVDIGSTGLNDTIYNGLYQKFMYGKYVHVLFSLFGRENVRILFFEDFRADFANFMKNLYKTIGVDEYFSPVNRMVIPAGKKITQITILPNTSV